MDNNTLIIIIKTTLPSLVAVLTVFLTSYFNNRIDRKKTLEHRIDIVYKPFYIAYLKYQADNMIWEELDVIKTISSIHSICLNNINCLKTETQGLVIKMASEFSIYTPGDSVCFKILEDDFNKLLKNMFKEYSQICCKLKYPEPLQPF